MPSMPFQCMIITWSWKHPNSPSFGCYWRPLLFYTLTLVYIIYIVVYSDTADLSTMSRGCALSTHRGRGSSVRPSARPLRVTTLLLSFSRCLWMSSDTTLGQASWLRPLDSTHTSTCVNRALHELDLLYTRRMHPRSACARTQPDLRYDDRQVLHWVSRHFSQPELVSESFSGNSLHALLQDTQQLGLPRRRRLRGWKNSGNAFKNIESSRNK